LTTTPPPAFDGIHWAHSYLLGWTTADAHLCLHVDLMLDERHVEFRPFDRKKEHGCYRLARLRADRSSWRGLEPEQSPPAWNEEMNEYTDVAEIESAQVGVSDVRLVCDGRAIEVSSSDRVLEFMDTQGPDAFDEGR
jgi:hypothetical protein